MNTIVPIPQIPISIRVATMDDFAAIDAIQKVYHKQLGFFPRAQMEGYIKSGWMVVVEDDARKVVGYCASRDRYLKRDELGAIFQLCVAPGSQRKFVGMSLLKHVFENAPYGCKLYCCWCAQDIEANYFWESLGFVPLAFRTGSEKKDRVHIFWQKRIRSGDNETPYWFPAQTSGGSIREERLVLPIPPGTHWRDVMPMILPKEEGAAPVSKQISGPKTRRQAKSSAPGSEPMNCELGQFGPPPPDLGCEPDPPPVVKTKPARKPKRKNDPKLVAAARELRDRWLERVNQVNQDPTALLSNGKYEVSRLPEPSTHRAPALLTAA